MYSASSASDSDESLAPSSSIRSPTSAPAPAPRCVCESSSCPGPGEYGKGPAARGVECSPSGEQDDEGERPYGCCVGVRSLSFASGVVARYEA